MGNDKGMPRKVRDLAEMARKNVTEVLQVEPDYTPETLPLLDEYLRRVPPDSSRPVRHLVVSTAGCYFGEVVRRVLKGRWAARGDHPEQWRIELSSCFLHFSPVGMAGEVASQGQDESYNGSVGTLDELSNSLHAALSEAPPVTEEEYYSLSCRVDILQLCADWLVGQAMALSPGGKPRKYLSRDYLQRLG